MKRLASEISNGLDVKTMAPFGVRIRMSPEELLMGAVEIKRLLKEHGLILFEGLQKLDERSMTAFMDHFGKPINYKGTPANFEADGGNEAGAYVTGYPHIRLLGNGRNQDGTPSSLLCDIGYEWHQDSAFVKDSPIKCFTLLHCKQTPARGAQTLWADTAKLYECLPQQQQAEVKTMNVMYSNRFTAGGPAAWDAAFGLRMNSSGTRVIRTAQRQRTSWKLSEMTAPLVHFNEETGCHHICTGAKNLDHIEGMTVDESRDKIDDILKTGLKPPSLGDIDDSGNTVSRTTFDEQSVYEHPWKSGDAILWDNIRFLHSTSPVSLYGSGVREMWQIIAIDEVRPDQEYAAALASYYGSK